MKLKTALIFLLFVLTAPLARAQDDDKFILSACQSVGPVLDLRLSSTQRDVSYPFAIYLSNVNFVVKQDYSNPSKYIVSLNPALWGIEYGLVNLFMDTTLAWTSIIPLTIMIADVFANLKFDIYWVHLGWNTDFYIYDKKFIAIFQLTLGLKYEFKNWAVDVSIKGTDTNRKPYPFEPPWVETDTLAELALSYNFNYTDITTFIFTRGFRTE